MLKPQCRFKLITPLMVVALLGTLPTYATLWLPSDASNLALWLDAADASSITESGGSVTQWNDKSGNGSHATVTGSTAPTQDTAFFGGLNSIRFDADPDAMQVTYSNTGGLYGAGGSTFIGVVRRDSAANGSADDWLWVQNGTDRPRLVFGNTEPTIQANSQDFIQPAGSFSRVNGAITNGLARDIEGVLFEHSTGNWETRETGSISIGNRETNDRNFDGNVGELIWYNAGLSDNDQDRLEGYLAHKWGLEGDLPSDHTYKLTAPMTIPEPASLSLFGMSAFFLIWWRKQQRRG